MKFRIDMKLGVAVSFLVVGTVVQGQSYAQSNTSTSAQDIAGAQALFDAGVELVKLGNYSEACPKFERSMRLDKTTNTIIRLADCDEHIGRIASANALFLEAAERLKKEKDPREVPVRERAEKLQPILPHAIVKVSPEMMAIPSFAITYNGIPLRREQWGEKASMDPGDIELKATADGHVPWVKKYSISEKQTVDVNVPNLEVIKVDTPNGPSKQKIASFITLGVGVAGVVVGSAFGAQTYLQYHDALENHCQGSKTTCDPTAIKLGQSADTSATIADIAFGVGIAGLVGGAVLYFTAPGRAATSSNKTVQIFPVGPGRVGTSVIVRF